MSLELAMESKIKSGENFTPPVSVSQTLISDMVRLNALVKFDILCI